jgi:TM2 domain-containing membrane protein YozV
MFKSTQSALKITLALIWLSIISGIFIISVQQQKLPGMILELMDNYPTHQDAMYGFSILLFILALASIQLLRAQNEGRYLFTAACLIMVVPAYYYGPILYSNGMESIVSGLTILLGIFIGLVFNSPINKMFQVNKSNNVNLATLRNVRILVIISLILFYLPAIFDSENNVPSIFMSYYKSYQTNSIYWDISLIGLTTLSQLAILLRSKIGKYSFAFLQVIALLTLSVGASSTITTACTILGGILNGILLSTLFCNPVSSQLEWLPQAYGHKNTKATAHSEKSSKKSALFAFICCLFLGWFGMHKFYVGNIKSGFHYLLPSIIYLLGIYFLVAKSFCSLLTCLFILSIFAAYQFGINGIQSKSRLVKIVCVLMLLVSFMMCAIILNDLYQLAKPGNFEVVVPMAILYTYLYTFALGSRPLIDLVRITQNKLCDANNQPLIFIKKYNLLKYYFGFIAFMIGFIFYVYLPALMFSYYFPV